MSDENLYASPDADVDVKQLPGEQELAGRWLRLFGAIIDAILAFLVVIPVLLMTDYMEYAMSGVIPLVYQLAIPAVAILSYAVLHGYFLAASGQTIGKKLVGIRIVSVSDGLNPGFLKILGLRFTPMTIVAQLPVIGAILGLVNILFIFGPEKRCLHDYIAGTRVIKA